MMWLLDDIWLWTGRAWSAACLLLLACVLAGAVLKAVDERGIKRRERARDRDEVERLLSGLERDTWPEELR